MLMTKKIAYAIGLDAGNRSMRAAGRSAWNEDDFNAASEATAAAFPNHDVRTIPAEQAPRCRRSTELGACEGTGRDCAEVHEIEMEDLRYGKLPAL